MTLLCIMILSAPVHGHTADTGATTVNIKQVADGLVAIVSSSQKQLDLLKLDCDQGSNEIIVDIPSGGDESSIENLLKNPLIVTGRVSSIFMSRENVQRVRIQPKLKLYCSGFKMVNRFQRYVTYSYPAGSEIKIIGSSISGFNFDENSPVNKTTGSISIRLADPLGNIDLNNAVYTQGNRLYLKLNPKDFTNQKSIFNAFEGTVLQVDKSDGDLAGEQIFTFKAVSSAEISKISASLVKSPASNELRIDITASLSLYDSGRKLYEAGDSKRAIRYMTAAKSEPAFSLVSRMSLGTIHWNEDNFAESYRIFKELMDIDKRWEFPEARYYAVKAYHIINGRVGFDLAATLKEFLRRCDRTEFATCQEARELSEQVSEPGIKLNVASKADLKKLVAGLSDPKLNFNEVQKSVFHYWAIWCPLCLEEMPKIMQYAVANPNILIYIISKYDQQKTIMNTLLKAGAIKRKNIIYYVDTKDDIMLKQMVPLALAAKEPVTPLPISVFLQREVPFYLTDRLGWTEGEISRIWQMKYRQ